ncbi:hypothetical protein [Blastococcus sp. Marseille-P5729]|uniref:hypothetical protein n=1 Tax=Blastococcus sp. Marseille-P5729 TaxID=2086582 RepID=UPI000D0EECEE|nr:hypothetical protein [Blastococcus sp. Marseille-P5729]
MRRIFWLSMGITIGVLVVRKLSAAADAVKPNALAERTGRGAANLADQARLFFADVRTAMRQREHELREGVGLDAGPEPSTKEI